MRRATQPVGRSMLESEESHRAGSREHRAIHIRIHTYIYIHICIRVHMYYLFVHAIGVRPSYDHAPTHAYCVRMRGPRGAESAGTSAAPRSDRAASDSARRAGSRIPSQRPNSNSTAVDVGRVQVRGSPANDPILASARSTCATALPPSPVAFPPAHRTRSLPRQRWYRSRMPR